jgi:hypothetical protein
MLQMLYGAIDWSLRHEYQIIEGGSKMNNIGKLTLIKVEQNGLIEATGYYQVLAILCQRTSGLASPDSSRFLFT